MSGRAAAASQYRHLNNRRVCTGPAGLKLNSAPVKTPGAVEQLAVECALSAKQAAPCGDSLGVNQKPDVQCKSQPGKFDICSKQEQSLLKNLSTDSISVAPRTHQKMQEMFVLCSM